MLYSPLMFTEVGRVEHDRNFHVKSGTITPESHPCAPKRLSSLYCIPLRSGIIIAKDEI